MTERLVDKIQYIFGVMDQLGINLTIFLDVVSWGDGDCMGNMNGIVFLEPVPAITTVSIPKSNASATSSCHSRGLKRDSRSEKSLHKSAHILTESYFAFLLASSHAFCRIF